MSIYFDIDNYPTLTGKVNIIKYEVDEWVAYNVPDSDIIEIKRSNSEQIKFNFSNIISADISLILNNIDDEYSDEDSDSVFYGDTWYNQHLVIKDDDGNVTWFGRLKDITYSEKEKTLTIKSTNFVQDIIDTECLQSYGYSSNITPAEVIYWLLNTVVGIPAGYINKNSFDRAQAVQTANSGYIQINYSSDNAKSVSAIIQEICRITSSYIYSQNDVIHYYQDSVFAGEAGFEVKASEIVPGTLEKGTSDDDIYNDFYIYYESGTGVGHRSYTGSAGYITDSRNRYGIKFFRAPDEEVDSSLASDFAILLTSSTGAAFYGNLKILKSFTLKKTLKFTGRDTLNHLGLNSQIDFTAYGYIREPLKIIEKKQNDNKGTIQFTCEFLNQPYEFVSRDITAPEPVPCTAFWVGASTALVRWWESSSDDVSRYRIEVAEVNGIWEGTFTGRGLSPIDVPVSALDLENGRYEYTITGLEENDYYIRVLAIDDDGNLSGEYNIVRLYKLNESFDYEKFYRLAGDFYTGIYLSAGVGGDPLEGWTLYGSGEYGEAYYTPTGYYDSPLFYSVNGYHSIRFEGYGDNGDITIQYRTSPDGAWSEEIDAIGPYSMTIKGEYMQFRLIFYSSAWTDEDYFVVREVA